MSAMQTIDLDAATLDGLSILVRHDDTACPRIARAHIKDAGVFVFSPFCHRPKHIYSDCTVVNLSRLIDRGRNTSVGSQEAVRELLDAAEPLDLVIIERPDLVFLSRYKGIDPGSADSVREAIARSVARGVRVVLAADDIDDVRDEIERAARVIVTGSTSAYVIERA